MSLSTLNEGQGVSMGQVRIVEQEAVPWMTPKVGQGGEMVETANPSIKGAVRFLHPGSEDSLYLHRSKSPPNYEVLSHAHLEDEIIYVLEGEMHVGARVLKPGDSIFIPGNTLYAFRTGPAGLSFLNFRGRHDNSHIMKEDFMKLRAARGMEAVADTDLDSVAGGRMPNGGYSQQTGVSFPIADPPG
jgi:quercetin dioxygenase-like cupin family protein